MESELQHDLLDVLEGLDPLELLAEDPTLSSLVQDVESDLCDHSKEPPIAQPNILPQNNFVTEKAKSKHDSNPGNIKKGPERETADEAPEGHLCSVCSGPSKGFKYYGTVSCTSCRAFFSRAIKGEAYKTYICQGLGPDSDCSIDSRSWGSCRLCRFKKCLTAGMVIPIRSKKSDHKRDGLGDCAMGVCKVEPDGQLLVKVKRLCQPSTMITTEEKLKMEKYSEFSMDLATKVMWKMCCSNMDFYLMMLEFVYYGNIFPRDMKKAMLDYMTFCSTEMYIHLDGPMGSRIKQADRLKLAAANIPPMLEYFIASKIGSKLDDENDVQTYIEALTKDQDENFANKIRSLNKQVCVYTQHNT